MIAAATRWLPGLPHLDLVGVYPFEIERSSGEMRVSADELGVAVGSDVFIRHLGNENFHGIVGGSSGMRLFLTHFGRWHERPGGPT
jgi:hypothetical protein